MEKRKAIVSCLFLLSTFLVTPGAAQCDRTVRIPHTGFDRQRIAVTRGPQDVVCLVCLTPDNGTSPFAVFIKGTTTLGPGIMDSEIGRNNGGVLELFPGVIIDGPGFGPFSCNPLSGGDNQDITLYTTNLVASVSASGSGIVREGEGASLVCSNQSPREVSIGVEWFKQGASALLSAESSLLFDPSRRENAGVYICRISSMLDNRTLSVEATLIVEFAPEVTFTADENMRIGVNGSISLTCDYEAVPMPMVDWFINGTFFLDPSTSRVTVDTNADRSTLTITELDRTEGGRYSCNVTNSVGSVTRNLTSVIILIPPAPVANLRVLDIGETTIELNWGIVFDGYTPITRAVVGYAIEGQEIQEVFVIGSSPTTVTLTGLMPFTNYSILVSLENEIGRSDSAPVRDMTLSLILGAPAVSAMADSSTQLTFTWMPPTSIATTEDSFDWFVEFRRRGTPAETITRTLDANTLMAVFADGVDGAVLEKGTYYEARVRGRNSRGQGNFSAFVEIETEVDPPSEPLNVTVSAINSVALMVTWEEPTDDGGRDIVRYNITIVVGATSVTRLTMAGGDARSFIIRDVGLIENTTYQVTVRAENSDGFIGTPVTADGTTQDIDAPQTILDAVETGTPTNNSVFLTWSNPGGTVDAYIIRYMPDNGGDADAVSVEVNGSLTSFNLVGLDAGVTYSVVLITVNSNGNSNSNPLALFSTIPADKPVVTGPEDTVVVGTDVTLTCTTPDTRTIMWQRLDGMPIEPPVYNVEGTMARSNLRINDVRVTNSGVYVCRVGQQTANFTLSVAEATDPPTEDGISTTVIIIAACVGGGGFLLILLLLGIIILCCCCSRDGNKTQYSTSKPAKAPRTDKRTNELFEVSTNVSYAPVDTGGPRDTGVSFDMPEDFHAHSSFNTLDKPKNRSSSPDEARPSSFAVAAPPDSQQASNEPRYQDMPPSYDGTVL